MRKSYEFESSESNGPPQGFGSPTPKNSRPRISAGARQRTTHKYVRHTTRLRAACMLALVTPLLWSPSSVLYTELAPQQSTTTARTSCSTVLQSSEGPARSTAELAVVGVVVGTKAHLSAIHRRSFPSLKAGYTVDAHIEALVDERDVASSFVPGHCSRRKAPYTAKYISLHLSYRRPGVQPPQRDCPRLWHLRSNEQQAVRHMAL